eukprot:2921324-Pleurochrysis_carterae.AAC.1
MPSRLKRSSLETNDHRVHVLSRSVESTPRVQAPDEIAKACMHFAAAMDACIPNHAAVVDTLNFVSTLAEDEGTPTGEALA